MTYRYKLGMNLRTTSRKEFETAFAIELELAQTPKEVNIALDHLGYLRGAGTVTHDFADVWNRRLYDRLPRRPTVPEVDIWRKKLVDARKAKADAERFKETLFKTKKNTEARELWQFHLRGFRALEDAKGAEEHALTMLRQLGVSESMSVHEARTIVKEDTDSFRGIPIFREGPEYLLHKGAVIVPERLARERLTPPMYKQAVVKERSSSDGSLRFIPGEHHGKFLTGYARGDDNVRLVEPLARLGHDVYHTGYLVSVSKIRPRTPLLRTERVRNCVIIPNDSEKHYINPTWPNRPWFDRYTGLATEASPFNAKNIWELQAALERDARMKNL